MKHYLRLITALGLVLFAATAVLPARGTDAAIHEIVAAYCSGGDVGVIGADGHLAPPAITDPGSPAFARPVIASGAVALGNPPTVTAKPNTKFEEGSSVFALDNSNVDHPSAEHCPNNALP